MAAAAESAQVRLVVVSRLSGRDLQVSHIQRLPWELAAFAAILGTLQYPGARHSAPAVPVKAA